MGDQRHPYDDLFCQQYSEYFWLEYAKRNAKLNDSENFKRAQSLYNDINGVIDLKECEVKALGCHRECKRKFIENFSHQEYLANPKSYSFLCGGEHTCLKYEKEIAEKLIEYKNLITHISEKYYCYNTLFCDESYFEIVLLSYFNIEKKKRKGVKIKTSYAPLPEGVRIFSYEFLPLFLMPKLPGPCLIRKIPPEQEGAIALMLEVDINNKVFKINEAKKQFETIIASELYSRGIFVNENTNNKNEFYFIKNFKGNSLEWRLVGLWIWDYKFKNSLGDESINEIFEKFQIFIQKETGEYYSYDYFNKTYWKTNKAINELPSSKKYWPFGVFR
jgi:phosphopantetheinyl transferase (holo-ACP synthase)